jgi:hypothetical protein
MKKNSAMTRVHVTSTKKLDEVPLAAALTYSNPSRSGIAILTMCALIQMTLKTLEKDSTSLMKELVAL